MRIIILIVCHFLGIISPTASEALIPPLFITFAFYTLKKQKINHLFSPVNGDLLKNNKAI